MILYTGPKILTPRRNSSDSTVATSGNKFGGSTVTSAPLVHDHPDAL